MKRVMVRYKVKPEYAAENEQLIRNVFAALGASKPEGVQYTSMKLADGVSFVHMASYTSDEARSAFTSLPEFKVFTADIKSRCDEMPVNSESMEIGSYAG